MTAAVAAAVGSIPLLISSTATKLQYINIHIHIKMIKVITTMIMMTMVMTIIFLLQQKAIASDALATSR